MKRCAVPSCQSLKYGRFSFPKNPALILKWLESLNMDSHKAGDKICKEHFNADQYYINKDSCRPYRLIQNSVPFPVVIKGTFNSEKLIGCQEAPAKISEGSFDVAAFENILETEIEPPCKKPKLEHVEHNYHYSHPSLDKLLSELAKKDEMIKKLQE